MTKIWKMGISTDNFIADTVNLTNEEIGIYFRLLCYAWKNEAYLPKLWRLIIEPPVNFG